MTWTDFLAAVELYQQHFSQRPDEDFAYLRCRRVLEDKTIAQRAGKARDIVRFLNEWNSGVNSLATPPVLAAWIREHADRLQCLVATSIADPALVGGPRRGRGALRQPVGRLARGDPYVGPGGELQDAAPAHSGPVCDVGHEHPALRRGLPGLYERDAPPGRADDRREPVHLRRRARAGHASAPRLRGAQAARPSTSTSATGTSCSVPVASPAAADRHHLKRPDLAPGPCGGVSDSGRSPMSSAYGSVMRLTAASDTRDPSP